MPRRINRKSLLLPLVDIPKTFAQNRIGRLGHYRVYARRFMGRKAQHHIVRKRTPYEGGAMVARRKYRKRLRDFLVLFVRQAPRLLFLVCNLRTRNLRQHRRHWIYKAPVSKIEGKLLGMAQEQFWQIKRPFLDDRSRRWHGIIGFWLAASILERIPRHYK